MGARAISAEDGLKRVRPRIEKLDENCTLYADDALALPMTKAKIRLFPFSRIARDVDRLAVATGAMATVLTDSGIFPVEALEGMIRKFQKPKIAETSLKAVLAGAELAKESSQ